MSRVKVLRYMAQYHRYAFGPVNASMTSP
jgi:hypothetical protein